MIEAVLGIEPIYHTFLYRLHNDNRAVEVCLLVHVPDNPIYKRAEEVAFAKLNNLFRHDALRSKYFVKWFHIIIVVLLFSDFRCKSTYYFGITPTFSHKK